MLKQYFLGKTKITKQITAALVVILIAGIGTYLIIGSHASSTYASITADQGSLSGANKNQSCSGSTTGSCVVFSSSTPACNQPANTPGGPDPWGGCWPGASNTGVPTGTSLVTTSLSNVLNGSANGNCSTSNNPPSSPLPSDNYGWFWDTTNQFIRVDCANAVIDGVSEASNYSVYVEAATTQCKDSNNNPGTCSLTIKNSQLGPINDAVGASLLVENSTINGGNTTSSPTVAGSNLTVTNSDLSGGKDEVNCEGNNCTVKDSYLHDNYNSGAGNHQQGFFVQAGTNDDLEHNSVYCVGECTADIYLLDASDINNVTANKNLLIA